VRITTFVAPFFALIAPVNSYNLTTVIVPRSDTSSYFHFIAWADADQPGIDTTPGGSSAIWSSVWMSTTSFGRSSATPITTICRTVG